MARSFRPQAVWVLVTANDKPQQGQTKPYKSDEAFDSTNLRGVEMDKVTKSVRKPPAKGGSRKGIPNKNTKAIKDMIIEALGKAGGVDYLVSCAKEPRTASAFLGLVGKVLPIQVTGEGGGAIKTITRVEIVPLTADK